MSAATFDTPPPIRRQPQALLYALAGIGIVLLLLTSCAALSLARTVVILKRNSTLVAASSCGDAARVHTLLLQGADPNSQHPEGSSALWWAVMSQNPATVHELLTHGATPNSRGQFNSVLDTAFANVDSLPTFMHDNTPPARILRDLVAHNVDPNTLTRPDDRQSFLTAVRQK